MNLYNILLLFQCYHFYIKSYYHVIDKASRALIYYLPLFNQKIFHYTTFISVFGANCFNNCFTFSFAVSSLKPLSRNTIRKGWSLATSLAKASSMPLSKQQYKESPPTAKTSLPAMVLRSIGKDNSKPQSSII